jgi:hypothetical protein
LDAPGVRSALTTIRTSAGSIHRVADPGRLRPRALTWLSPVDSKVGTRPGRVYKADPWGEEPVAASCCWLPDGYSNFPAFVWEACKLLKRQGRATR